MLTSRIRLKRKEIKKRFRVYLLLLLRQAQVLDKLFVKC